MGAGATPGHSMQGTPSAASCSHHTPRLEVSPEAFSSLSWMEQRWESMGRKWEPMGLNVP